jgi:hypothetical protein
MEPRDTPHGKVALQFAKALGAGKYTAAHAMLSPELQKEMTAADLGKKYEEMISYGSGPADYIDVINLLDDWPGREDSDVGWAYATFSGPMAKGGSWVEAVAVVVTHTGQDYLIRDITWGRP